MIYQEKQVRDIYAKLKNYVKNSWWDQKKNQKNQKNPLMVCGWGAKEEKDDKWFLNRSLIQINRHSIVFKAVHSTECWDNKNFWRAKFTQMALSLLNFIIHF